MEYCEPEYQNRYGICEYCGSGDAYYEADPYAQGMSGDETPRWICSDCRGDRAMSL